MFLQNERGFLVLKMVRFLAAGTERALSFHKMSTNVKFRTEVLRAAFLAVEISTELDGDDRFYDERSPFLYNEEKARVQLQKRSHSVPLRSLFKHAHNSFNVLDF